MPRLTAGMSRYVERRAGDALAPPAGNARVIPAIPSPAIYRPPALRHAESTSSLLAMCSRVTFPVSSRPSSVPPGVRGMAECAG